MTSQEIRQQFLDFFKTKQHQIVASAPLVLKNDPTLMFTNSGMAQFKDFFLGNAVPPSKRIADTQKCLRVSGKHNDLEDVGFDTYHHTMFEMLGNWSFGDYFKKEAITWAWELLTEVYQLPKERLYVSVFEGDKKDNVPFDQEAWDLWKPIVGEDRIILGNKKDNFWEMGDTGPCGPCSEIHVDLRPQSEVDQIPGKSLVNNDHPQVVEIWNLVFMQFNRLANGSLESLPATHVDTGMGFERLCMAIQRKTSNYDTDVFQGTIQFIAAASGKQYGTEKYPDIAMRVIADHIRAIAFTIADGQLPANNKAGYVIRRILRRAVRYAYTYLGIKEPFLCRLVPLLADQFAAVFPELKAQQDFVAKVIQEEENSFLRTLEIGLKKLDLITLELSRAQIEQGQKAGKIDGETVFELYDTFGFPVDLTALIAREKGFSIDEEGFKKEMDEQKRRSQKAAATSTTDWVTVNESDAIEFVGYEELESQAQVVKFREVKAKNTTQYQIVLDRTPFYAESGGQVGDTGLLQLTVPGRFADAMERNEQLTINIIDTKKENDLIIHISEDKNLASLLQAEGVHLTAKVDRHKRLLTANNHSATHLLQAALREVLGSHVAQKGSYVSNEVLRFDFSHFAKLTDEEIHRIEQIVNRRIRQNIPLNEQRNVPIEQAKKLGAMALFGEKYGDFVRVITFDRDFSVELCGGIHVPATGQIGFFKIISESSIQAGVRRIEAITAEKAEAYVDEQVALINDLKELLKSPVDLKKSLEGLLEEKSQLSKQIEQFEQQQLQVVKQHLLTTVRPVNGFQLIAERVQVTSADMLKQLVYELKAKVDNGVLILAADIQGKPQLAIMIADELVKEKGLHAGNLVKELAKEIKGGGGGQPFFATAGGSDISGLDRALEKAQVLVKG
ncbi:MAG: alanine--tRNA ligase [Bacteroidota bacterium]